MSAQRPDLRKGDACGQCFLGRICLKLLPRCASLSLHAPRIDRTGKIDPERRALCQVPLPDLSSSKLKEVFKSCRLPNRVLVSTLNLADSISSRQPRATFVACGKSSAALVQHEDSTLFRFYLSTSVASSCRAGLKACGTTRPHVAENGDLHY